MAVINTPQGAFDFTAYDKNTTTWRNVSGVYMFVRHDITGNNVLYVGLCESFSQRIPGHDRWDEAVRLGANSVHAVVVPDKATREALEKHLIGQFQPPLNVQGKG